MTTEMVPSRWFSLSAVGVQVHGEVPQDVWCSTLEAVLRFRDALPWIVGDLILYGESRYGETYAQAIQVTGRAYDTLAGYVRVCRAIPFEERNPDLPFSYHRAVALRALTAGQRADYLGRAQDGEFENSTALAEQVRADLAPGDREAVETVECPICGANGWDLRALNKTQCPHCRARGSELVDLAARYEMLEAAYNALADEYTTLCERTKLEAE